MISDMDNKFKVGDKVRLNQRHAGHQAGKEGAVTRLEEWSLDTLVSVSFTDGTCSVCFAWRLDLIESPKEYTLHGRPVKEGDRVYYLPSEVFCLVARSYPGEEWIALENVIENPQDCTWDVPPVVDPRTIPPPLCFIDGLPVRVGSIMYHTLWECAVVITGDHPNNHQYLMGSTPENPPSSKARECLSWDFPNTPPAPKKVRQLRTRWYNIYDHDATRTSYSTFNSKEEAQKYALQGCQGQGSFQYPFVGPAKQ
jgi:hypothetical protein